MSKKRKLAKQKKTEPYLCIAVFCERVLEDKDGVLSTVRIVDKIIMQAVTAEMPAGSHMAPGMLAPRPVANIVALIGFRAGGTKGKRTIKLTGRSPDGKAMQEITHLAEFKGGNQTYNLRANMSIEVSQEGIYWIEVFLDGKRVNRMPLEVVHQQIALTAASASKRAQPQTNSSSKGH